MVMRYAHHPKGLRAGVEILDRMPTGVSTSGGATGMELMQVVDNEERKIGCGGGILAVFQTPLRIALK